MTPTYTDGHDLIPSIEEQEAQLAEAAHHRAEQQAFDAGFAEYERRLEDERLDELEARQLDDQREGR